MYTQLEYSLQQLMHWFCAGFVYSPIYFPEIMSEVSFPERFFFYSIVYGPKRLLERIDKHLDECFKTEEIQTAMHMGNKRMSTSSSLPSTTTTKMTINYTKN